MTSIGPRFEMPRFEIHPLPKKIDSENMVTLFINCVDFGKTGTAMGAALYDMLCSKAKVILPSDKDLEKLTEDELVAFYVRSLKLPFTGKIEDGMSDEAGHIALESIREAVVHPIYNLLIKNKILSGHNDPIHRHVSFGTYKPSIKPDITHHPILQEIPLDSYPQRMTAMVSETASLRRWVDEAVARFSQGELTQLERIRDEFRADGIPC